MKLALLILHVRRGVHPVLKHSHELTRVRHIRLVSVQCQQVLRNVLKIILQDLSPLVSKSEFFDVFG